MDSLTIYKNGLLTFEIIDPCTVNKELATILYDRFILHRKYIHSVRDRNLGNIRQLTVYLDDHTKYVFFLRR